MIRCWHCKGRHFNVDEVRGCATYQEDAQQAQLEEIWAEAYNDARMLGFDHADAAFTANERLLGVSA